MKSKDENYSFPVIGIYFNQSFCGPYNYFLIQSLVGNAKSGFTKHEKSQKILINI